MLKIKKDKVTPQKWHIEGRISGRRYRKTFDAPNRALAEAYKSKIEAELWERTALGDEGTGTLSQCAEHYLAQGGEARFLAPLIREWGNERVVNISPAEVSRVATRLYPEHKASTLRRQFYVPLNAVINAGYKVRLCPLIRFESPKVAAVTVEYAEDSWMRAFLATAAHMRERGFRISTCVLLMTMTGARVGEVLRLRVRDIEDGYVTFQKTKNGKARRARVPDAVHRALLSLSEGKDLDDDVFIMANRHVVNKQILAVCERAGIKYYSSHKCGRHAFAARLLRQGESLRVVQEAGGWASIGLLGKTYGHIEQTHVDSSIDKMGDRFFG